MDREEVTIHLQEARGWIIEEAGKLTERWVSKNIRQRSQVDRDFWNGLFDAQSVVVAGFFRLSI